MRPGWGYGIEKQRKMVVGNILNSMKWDAMGQNGGTFTWAPQQILNMAQEAREMPDEVPFLGLTVQNSSTSKRVTIPADVARDAGVRSGDRLEAVYDREERTLTFFLD
jgi:hypothetical protein